MSSVPPAPTDPQLRDLLEALLRRVERMERWHSRIARLLDEGIGAYLNARFPYGEPTDRWRRRP